MKKSYNPISDGNNEKNELTRRIYRSLSEVVRQLDDIRGRSKTISDLFLPCLATLIIKLHDLCYKLILTDPLGYGKKGEELLWKKGYHDVFTTAKRLKKNDKWSPQEAGFVQGLLISGVGHYQHLLFKLQSDYKVNIQGLIDFPISISDLGLSKAKNTQQKPPDKNLEEWAKDSCHRCLIYLGDLNRYLLDIFPLWDSGAAERYYLQAANLNVNCGRPFNQLGTLAGTKNYNLDAVYYYMRCIIRPESFEGAEANLRKTLDKNFEFVQVEPVLPSPVPSIQKLISKFLLIFDILYLEKSVDYNVQDLNQEMLLELDFCFGKEIENSFELDINELELSNITPFNDRIHIHPSSLNADMILKIIVLTLVCIEKLRKKDSENTSVAVAMSLEIFSLLLQKTITRFQKFYTDLGLVEKCDQETQKSEIIMNDNQPKAGRTDKYRKKKKYDGVISDKTSNGYSNAQGGKKCMKYSEKKRDKNNHLHETTCNNSDVSDLNVNDADILKDKGKKKSRLKTRRRVRAGSLGDSELSDSDITLNDSSSENEFPSGDSESEEVVSSDSEGLDETLLIINQKIKEKKLKENQKNCELNGVVKNSIIINDTKELKNGNIGNVKYVDKDVSKFNILEQNGWKVTSDKDKTKSLFTIVNGVEEHGKLNENSGGDYTHEEKSKSVYPHIESVNFSKLSLKENEQGDFSTKETTDVSAELNTKKLDLKELFNFLSQQDILKPVKILFDWLMCNPEVLKTSVKNNKTLLTKIVTLLNLIKYENDLILRDMRNHKNSESNIPLSEDIITRGLSMLRESQEKLDWDFHKTNTLSAREELLLRLLRLVEFGHFLVKQEETGIVYDKVNHLFFIAGQNGVTNSLGLVNEKEMNNSSMRKGQLMKNMGQLWLKAEVRDLESRVRKRAGNFSPYLVIDCEALIEHIVLVKQLVGSRQFIVIIPTVVLSHLDECKRDSGRARETIRWLESQFQHGNRSLRAQKSQEKFSLPLIKYPKKKDKEAWNFFQIVECCHYFSKQSEFQNCHSSLLVTLLTGQKDIAFASDNRKDDFGKEYSPIGVAKNFGINLEHIEAFHTKWKLSTKSHG
ncbi:UNVERIFIED_CONTAM: hypothetical protein PYX00_007862 [Menopon gallinae]|uniref:Protein SMG5 n=1 Tax=Menopon gallinae TaxID=328185 RepID=A0AAW2HKV8_9NEOP